ncbi:hypothetical protein HELRODRAFT_104950, partial [Helobdella robusta]|uniref:ubiquitinyl hydrolase 1 n=1 Tax=Helobdella robusta TaxID=6412 RepID=T1EDP3_HELRO
MNHGNTCYINAIIQCLNNTTKFVEFLLKYDFNNNNTGLFACLLRNLLNALWTCRYKSGMSLMLANYVSRSFQQFEDDTQNDAQEFLLLLLDKIMQENRLREIKNININNNNNVNNDAGSRTDEDDVDIVKTLFGASLVSCLTCSKCQHCSTTIDPLLNICLPIELHAFVISPSTTVQQFLSIVADRVGVGCSKQVCRCCRCCCSCCGLSAITQAPKMLLMFRQVADDRVKLHTKVDFPVKDLNMKPFLRKPSSPSPSSDYIYDLFAVCNHHGDLHNGHYTAYCRHPLNLSWYSYDDNKVNSLPVSNIVTSSAYLLFYEKRSHASDWSADLYRLLSGQRSTNENVPLNASTNDILGDYNVESRLLRNSCSMSVDALNEINDNVNNYNNNCNNINNNNINTSKQQNNATTSIEPKKFYRTPSLNKPPIALSRQPIIKSKTLHNDNVNIYNNNNDNNNNNSKNVIVNKYSSYGYDNDGEVD